MTNWIKKQEKNNYGKAEIQKIKRYYAPLIAWAQYNQFKTYLRDQKSPKDLSPSNTQ